MNQQAGVTEDLKLLADFIPHVAIIGMKFFQFAGEGVGVGGCKFGAIRKRWRATAVQNADACAGDLRIARSVLECASPLALFLREPPHNVQHVQGPAALGDGNFFQQPAPKSFGGLTRLNFSRTSDGVATTTLSPRD